MRLRILVVFIFSCLFLENLILSNDNKQSPQIKCATPPMDERLEAEIFENIEQALDSNIRNFQIKKPAPSSSKSTPAPSDEGVSGNTTPELMPPAALSVVAAFVGSDSLPGTPWVDSPNNSRRPSGFVSRTSMEDVFARSASRSESPDLSESGNNQLEISNNKSKPGFMRSHHPITPLRKDDNHPITPPRKDDNHPVTPPSPIKKGNHPISPIK